MWKISCCAMLANLAIAGAALAVAPPIPGPAKSGDALVEAGAKRFNQNCVYCHGNAGSGGKAAALQGRDDLTREYVSDVIANGKQRGSFIMPAWKNSFNEQQILELASYILSLKNVNVEK